MAACARMLLEGGTKPDAKNGVGWTALAMATTADLAEVLMDGGAPLDATDSHGIPAFHSAFQAATGADMRRWLAACLQHGADLNAPAGDGLSLTQRILDAALAGRYSGSLLNRSDFDENGRHRGRLDQTEGVLDALLQAGGRIAGVDGQGRNALHRLAPEWSGYAPAIAWLIRRTKGFLMRQADPAGLVPEIPLLAALRRGCETSEPVLKALAEVEAAVLAEDLPTAQSVSPSCGRRLRL